MKRRLNLTQAVVVPWEIPDIAAAARKAPPPAFLETPLGQEAAALGASFGKANGAAAPKAEASATPTADPASLPAHAEGLERGLREGRELGYAEGFAAGRQAGEAQAAELVRRLDAVTRRLGEPMRSLERPVEEAVVALALEVARWVIGGEIARSRDYLLRLVRGAVAQVPIDVGVPAIVLNPADIEAIRALAPDLESNGIALIADETIEPGGARVIANGAEGIADKDRRWHPRALQGICEVDLTLASRWRDAMLGMFEGEDT